MRRRHFARKRILLCFCALLVCLFVVTFFALSGSFRGETTRREPEFLYGITVDDSWNEHLDTAQVVSAIRAMPVKPTARIVMTAEVSPREYRSLFSEIGSVANVMASPVDSYYMNRYEDAESYLRRFRESYEALSEYVDIWEIGNEINGTEWIGQESSRIVEKVFAAGDFIRSRGGTTALTLYYTDPAKEDLFRWASEYLSDDRAQLFDYVFLSYYEDDNEGYLPDWDTVFSELAKLFPNARIGIGECGSTSAEATLADKVEKARAYYSMTNVSPNFVGGFFWWNWVEDCVPHEESEVYREINRCIERRAGS